MKKVAILLMYAFIALGVYSHCSKGHILDRKVAWVKAAQKKGITVSCERVWWRDSGGNEDHRGRFFYRDMERREFVRSPDFDDEEIYFLVNSDDKYERMLGDALYLVVNRKKEGK